MLNSLMLGGLFFFAGLQALFAFLFWGAVLRRKKTGQKSMQNTVALPVSVIICARNEAVNLRRNLPLVLAQRYFDASGEPFFEVIVVDDASTDNTCHLLQTLAAQHPNLKCVHLRLTDRRQYPGKKSALRKGLDAATYDHVVLLDADCTPASEDWLLHMATPLAKGKEIVAGYGAYFAYPGLLPQFIRWETLHTFLQTRAWDILGYPYMAVGRNLASTRNAFARAELHPAWSALPSGDDDILVAANATTANYSVVDADAAATYSIPKRTLRQYIRQKQRHLSTGKFYRTPIKQFLGLYALSHGMGWLLFFLCFFFTQQSAIAFWVFGIRCLLMWSLWAREAVVRREASLIPCLPLFDFLWAVYNLFFAPYIFWKSKQQWT